MIRLARQVHCRLASTSLEKLALNNNDEMRIKSGRGGEAWLAVFADATISSMVFVKGRSESTKEKTGRARIISHPHIHV